LSDLERDLMAFLGPQLKEITKVISESASDGFYRVEIPTGDTVDLPLEELSSLVARTSNVFGRAARFSGMARAAQKLAKGKYDRKYKQNRVGKNDAERDKNATENTKQEHLELTVYESIAELAESLEHASRVASESSRKIFDKAGNTMVAQQREDRGTYREQDFVN